MRKVILLMLLAAVSGNAVAEWVEFTRNNDFVGYIDTANIVEADNKLKVWSLLDYSTVKTISGKSYLSVKAQHEFDCGKGQAGKLFTSLHSGNMGRDGVVSSSYRSENMEPVQPGSILELILKIVCE
jgi:hypothetical protein